MTNNGLGATSLTCEKLIGHIPIISYNVMAAKNNIDSKIAITTANNHAQCQSIYFCCYKPPTIAQQIELCQLTHSIV